MSKRPPTVTVVEVPSNHLKDIGKVALQVLETAKQILPTIHNEFKLRSELNHLDFKLPVDWRSNFDVEQLLEKNGGFVKISNFLPEDVIDPTSANLLRNIANNVLATVKSIKSAEWEISEAEDDEEAQDTDHTFFSSDSFPNCRSIFRMFRRLIKGKNSTFSAGKYTKGHFIDEHSDSAKQIIGDELYSRSIALVYYCTKDWKEEYGKLLMILC